MAKRAAKNKPRVQPSKEAHVSVRVVEKPSLKSVPGQPGVQVVGKPQTTAEGKDATVTVQQISRPGKPGGPLVQPATPAPTVAPALPAGELAHLLKRIDALYACVKEEFGRIDSRFDEIADELKIEVVDGDLEPASGPKDEPAGGPVANSNDGG